MTDALFTYGVPIGLVFIVVLTILRMLGARNAREFTDEQYHRMRRAQVDALIAKAEVDALIAKAERSRDKLRQKARTSRQRAHWRKYQ